MKRIKSAALVSAETRALERKTRLDWVYQAIHEGRAYLDTAWGKRRVIGYRDSTGWAVTNNRTGFFDQQSFLVTLEDIHISEAVRNEVNAQRE